MSTNLELLRMARELVINEYIDRRAQDHNKWLIESDHLWRTQRLRLAYPDFPPYPNEHDIIERAKRLSEFVGVIPESASPQVTEVNEVQPPPAEESTSTAPIVASTVDKSIEESTPQTLPAVEEQPSLTPADLDYIQAKVANDIDDTVSSSRKILPELIKKLESLRTSLKR